MDTLLDYITVDPHICHGQPCIKDTRILVHLILELLETGITPEQIIRDYYPQLTKRGIEACLHYATTLVRDAEFIPYEMTA
ncbi:MAG: DUF433 domain-containing protein [Thermodesulfobacteriota bacterium]|jgi:uncharacterized protein (DUF433 family)